MTGWILHWGVDASKNPLAKSHVGSKNPWCSNCQLVREFSVFLKDMLFLILKLGGGKEGFGIKLTYSTGDGWQSLRKGNQVTFLTGGLAIVGCGAWRNRKGDPDFRIRFICKWKKTPILVNFSNYLLGWLNCQKLSCKNIANQLLSPPREVCQIDMYFLWQLESETQIVCLLPSHGLWGVNMDTSILNKRTKSHQLVKV